jgi:hypothetical protein
VLAGLATISSAFLTSGFLASTYVQHIWRFCFFIYFRTYLSRMTAGLVAI